MTDGFVYVDVDEHDINLADVQLEIAHQLKRIADALEKEE